MTCISVSTSAHLSSQAIHASQVKPIDRKGSARVSPVHHWVGLGALCAPRVPKGTNTNGPSPLVNVSNFGRGKCLCSVKRICSCKLAHQSAKVSRDWQKQKNWVFLVCQHQWMFGYTLTGIWLPSQSDQFIVLYLI